MPDNNVKQIRWLSSDLEELQGRAFDAIEKKDLSRAESLWREANKLSNEILTLLCNAQNEGQGEQP